MNPSNIKTDVIAQSDNFIAWKAQEPDEEVTYHLELNNVTVHFFIEEWEEFLEFKKAFVDIPEHTTGNLAETENYFLSCDLVDDHYLYSLELPGASLFYFEEDWQEICDLLRSL